MTNPTRSAQIWTAGARALFWPSLAIGLVMGTLGCDMIHRDKAPEPDKFELRQDTAGRVLRLNKATGEIVVVQGTQLIPLKSSGDIPPPADTKAARAPAKAAPGGTSKRGGAENSVPAADTPTPLEASAGQTVATIAKASVFLTANEKQTPLIVANKGTPFKVLGTDGDWYRIEFDDPQWGRRVGFVSKRNVAATP